MLSPLISRILIYIFLLLSIIIIFMFCLAQYIISGKVLPFGLVTAPRVFMALTKPISFLWHCKGLCIVIYLNILVLVHFKQVGRKGLIHFCVLYWFTLDYIIFFPSLTFASLRLSVFRVKLGYCPYVRFPATWQVSWHSAVGSFFVADPTLLQSIRSNPFRQGHFLCQWPLKNCGNCVVSFRVTCWLFTTLLPTCSLLSFFPFHLSSTRVVISFATEHSSLAIPFPDVIIATDAMPTHWAFYFQDSGLPLSVSGSWSGFMCRAHIALQDLQAVSMLMCRMVFHLPGKVDALNLDNSPAKLYLCNQGSTISPFCFQISLPNIESDQQAQYYSYSSVHFYPSLCGGWLSVMGSVASGVASSSSDGPSSFSPVGSMRGWSASILPYLSMLALFHLESAITLRGLRVECLQPSLEVSGKLCLSSSFNGCQRLTQTFDSGGTMLDGGFLASHSSQHVRRYYSAKSYCKRSHHRCVSRPCAQGSALSAFNSLAAQRCVLCRQGSLPQSVR